MWNLVADTCLNLAWADHCHIQAYADDFALLVSAQSRRNLEERTDAAVRQFRQWAADFSLVISAEKTAAVVFGNLKRKPKFLLGVERIPIKTSIRYLGVVIDNKLGWTQHARYIKNKAIESTRNIIGMVAKTWGVTGTILKIWYKAVAERILLYASTAWAIEANCHVYQILSSAQRHFLLLISRAYRHTSTDALGVVTGIPPVKFLAKKVAKQGRFLRLNCNIDGHSRQDYEEEVTDDTIHPAQASIISHLEGDDNEDQLDDTTKIYTDGSKTSNGTGCAFVVYFRNNITYKWSKRLRDNNSVFQAELLAIKYAIKYAIDNSPERKNFIFTDSESALKALAQLRPTSAIVQNIKHLIIESSINIQLRWVKAHIGVEGNEAADIAAKTAANTESTPMLFIKYPQSRIKWLLKYQLMKEWQEHWATSEKGRPLYAYIQQVSEDMLINDRRLIMFLTDHGPFPTGQFKLGLRDTEYCACERIGSPFHYAVECPLTEHLHLRRPPQTNEDMWKKTLLSNNNTMKQVVNITQFIIDNEEIIFSTVPDPSVPF